MKARVLAALCVWLAVLPAVGGEVEERNCKLFERLPPGIPEGSLPHITMSAQSYTLEVARILAWRNPEWEVLCKGTPEWEDRFKLLGPPQTLPRRYVFPGSFQERVRVQRK